MGGSLCMPGYDRLYFGNRNSNQDHTTSATLHCFPLDTHSSYLQRDR